jgi:hypothetical protein
MTRLCFSETQSRVIQRGLLTLASWPFPRLRLLVLSSGVTHHVEIPFSMHCLWILPKLCSLPALRQAVRQTLTREENACLREIIDRSRFGFLMAALR